MRALGGRHRREQWRGRGTGETLEPPPWFTIPRLCSTRRTVRVHFQHSILVTQLGTCLNGRDNIVSPRNIGKILQGLSPESTSVFLFSHLHYLYFCKYSSQPCCYSCLIYIQSQPVLCFATSTQCKDKHLLPCPRMSPDSPTLFSHLIHLAQSWPESVTDAGYEKGKISRHVHL